MSDQGKLSKLDRRAAAFAAALSVRVTGAAGPDVKYVTWEEFMRMKDDAAFESFAQYSTKLLCYADGSLRPQPLRPLLANEVGMYKGKIYCLNSNMGDSHVGDLFQVKEALNTNRPLSTTDAVDAALAVMKEPSND